jgi:uncharacterized protein
VIPLLDVNILVSAHRGEALNHLMMLDYLNELRSGQQFFAVPEIAFSSLLRLVTNPKMFKPPSTPDGTLAFIASISRSAKCLVVRPSETHWLVFENLVRRVNAAGNLIPDAYLAAMAIDQGYEFVTNDSDFARFPGLTWRNLLAAHSTTNRS